jgi:hypothetical protein
MAKPQPVVPVKLLAAVLWAEPATRDEALAVMSQRFGAIDFHGPDRPFDATDYYQPEMGAGLMRRLVAFEPLAPPESLGEAKLICNEIEDQFAAAEGRRVNLDIGYLDHNKIVLASLKYAGQKIHLGDGVYADLIARYNSGHYRPFEWTFPDFRDGRYDEELFTIRRRYLQQLRGK